jgi:hypothetical protein
MIELLDSINKGYPVGSILLWQTSAKIGTERDLGDLVIPSTRDQYPTNYILDGQQRLTTLYGCLRWKKAQHSSTSPFDIYYDVASRKFVMRPAQVKPTHLPLNALLDTRAFLKFQSDLQAYDATGQLVDVSASLLETFQDYAIPTVTVKEPRIEDVAVMFERINSTGTKLTVFDLMVAATWSKDFDLRDEVEKTAKSLSRKGFKNVARLVTLQTMSGGLSTSASRDSIFNLREHNADKLAKLSRRSRKAIERGVDFLKTDLGVVSEDFLPYERQLIAFSTILMKHPRLTSSGFEALAKYFWRTTFFERYRSGGEGLFDDDLEALSDSVKNQDALKRFRNNLSLFALYRATFRKNSAFANGFVAVLARQHPKSLWTGAAIDVEMALSDYNRKEFHHVFPQAHLPSVSIMGETGKPE